MTNAKKIASIVKLSISIILTLLYIYYLYIDIIFFVEYGDYFFDVLLTLVQITIFVITAYFAFLSVKAQSNVNERYSNNTYLLLAFSIISMIVLFIYNYGYDSSIFYLYYAHFIIIGISIYELIDNNKSTAVQSPRSSTAPQNLNKLIEYKELLDIGAITQEEYDKMKKEILSNK